MNCRSFEDCITDIAGNTWTEESVRQEALAHAGSCPRCAALLAAEKELNSLIQLCKEHPEEAPAHIESALIAEFRHRDQSAGRIRWSSWLQPVHARRWGIAAAVILFLLALPAYRWLRNFGATPELVNQPAIATVPSPESGRSASTAKPAAPVDTSVANQAGMTGVPGKSSVPETEIATDFISLIGGAGQYTIESGQIVRVRLPRSALISYGLPVNQDRLNDPITAQVLLGEDGMAYAIRFLTETDSGSFRPATYSKQ